MRIPRLGLPILAAAAALVVGAGGAGAAITTIDFESFAVPVQSCGTSGPVTVGPATISGGALFPGAGSAFPADRTNMYGTTNGVVCTAHSGTITIAFSEPVGHFSVLVLNAVTYQPWSINTDFTVESNLGETVTQAVGAGEAVTFTLAGTGITTVTVGKTDRVPSTFLFFFVDDISFTTAEPAAPWVPLVQSEAIASSYLCWNREMFNPVAYIDGTADEMWKTGRYFEPQAILGNVAGGTNIGAYHLVCNAPDTMTMTGLGLGGSGEVYGAEAMLAYHAAHAGSNDLNVYHIWQ